VEKETYQSLVFGEEHGDTSVNLADCEGDQHDVRDETRRVGNGGIN
jgi:hypothetical protein